MCKGLSKSVTVRLYSMNVGFVYHSLFKDNVRLSSFDHSVPATLEASGEDYLDLSTDVFVVLSPTDAGHDEGIVTPEICPGWPSTDERYRKAISNIQGLGIFVRLLTLDSLLYVLQLA